MSSKVDRYIGASPGRATLSLMAANESALARVPGVCRSIPFARWVFDATTDETVVGRSS